MSDPTLPSFRYRLEQQPPHTSCGGLVRSASVRQFPVSQGIAGASMRLQPGSLRELHWHTTAAELGYVVSGSCRTTVLSPDGAATDTFGPGDVGRRCIRQADGGEAGQNLNRQLQTFRTPSYKPERKQLKLQEACQVMAIPAELEPATSCFEGTCSIQLSYGTI